MLIDSWFGFWILHGVQPNKIEKKRLEMQIWPLFGLIMSILEFFQHERLTLTVRFVTHIPHYSLIFTLHLP